MTLEILGAAKIGKISPMLCFIIILLTVGEQHRDARIFNTAFVDLTLAKNMRRPEVEKKSGGDFIHF